MVFVVDGYNVIHALPALERKLSQSLKASRDELLSLCRDIRGRRGDAEKIIIVFDGDSAFCDLPQENAAGVEIQFTESGEDADDRIRDLLDKYASRKNVCVVSNDNYVCNHARAFGALRLNAAGFQALSAPKKNPPVKVSAGSADDLLPDSLARELTEEYKRHLRLE